MRKIKSLKHLKNVANKVSEEPEMASEAMADKPAEDSEMPKKAKYDEYQLKSMADDVMRAHEHMADPELMKHLEPHLDKKRKAVKSLDDLKAMASKKY